MRPWCLSGLSALCGVAVATTAACRQDVQTPVAPVPTATIRDIMDAIVDPSADALWNSVGTTFSEQGVEERAPRTDEDWAALRRHALQLVEAPNMLIVPGRAVAGPGETNEHSDVERSPEEIQMAIDADRQGWTELLRGLQHAVVPILEAIDARNVERLAEANGRLDAACERCHLKYWYPDDSLARELLDLSTGK